MASTETRLEAPRAVPLKEAIREIGIGLTKGYALAQAGEFPARCFRVGNKYFVSRADLDRLIDGDAADREPA